MSNFIIELNNYIENDTTLIALTGKPSIVLRPMVGYETDTSPVILYWWYPGIKSVEAYYINEDSVKYTVLDEDFDRCLSIGNRIITLLNKADNIQNAGTGFTNFIPKCTFLTRAETLVPTEREGFYSFTISITAIYVPIA